MTLYRNTDPTETMGIPELGLDITVGPGATIETDLDLGAPFAAVTSDGQAPDGSPFTPAQVPTSDALPQAATTNEQEAQ